MPWQDVRLSVCPSVCLSVTRRYALWHLPKSAPYINLLTYLLTYLLNFFSPFGSQTLLVFPYQTGWQYSHRDPPNGGVECKGVSHHETRT